MKNYRTWAAMNNVPLDDSLVEDDEDDAMEMDDADAGGNDDEDVEPMDDDTPEFFKELNATAAKAPEKTKSKRKKTKVAALVRSKIERALESTELMEKRARLCDETDFLKLLSALNSEGIHFA
ncbi:hypothetical protein COL5a_003199 [Colletotrichum fioriniae]|nr:hypothetical protein COL5a_003199 [Colletotrichum fioriniae]